MTDFPVFGPDDLDAPQRALWDKLTFGPRGFYTGGPDTRRLPDLYNAWLQFPAFGDIVLQLGDAVRGCAELTGRMRELIVLTTSMLLRNRVEYDFHVPFARAQGLDEAAIAAIGAGETPPLADAADRAVYEANVQLVRDATLTDDARAAVIAAIGYPGLVQLIAVVSLYVLTAYTSNVAKVELAEDFSADPDRLQAFYAGRSAAAPSPVRA